MRWIWTSAAALVLLGSAWLYGATREPARPAELEAVELAIPELHCPIWCPIRVDRSLQAEPGLFDVRVDVKQRKVFAKLDPHRTTAARLVQNLEADGWNARIVD